MVAKAMSKRRVRSPDQNELRRVIEFDWIEVVAASKWKPSCAAKKNDSRLTVFVSVGKRGKRESARPAENSSLQWHGNARSELS